MIDEASVVIEWISGVDVSSGEVGGPWYMISCVWISPSPKIESPSASFFYGKGLVSSLSSDKVGQWKSL